MCLKKIKYFEVFYLVEIESKLSSIYYGNSNGGFSYDTEIDKSINDGYMSDWVLF